MRKGLIWHDMEQGSDEWHQIRMGKVTGTAAKELLVNGKGLDGLGAGAWTLIDKMAREIVTGETDPNFDTWATQRGKALEDLALQAYMDQTFYQCSKVGFVQWGEYAGCSPDFGVDETRGGEIKCLNTKHFTYIRTRRIEKDYFAQIQWNLFITGFQYWDLVHFHPKAGKQRLIIDTIEPDLKIQDRFAKTLPKVEKHVKEIVKLCKEKAA